MLQNLQQAKSLLSEAIRSHTVTQFFITHVINSIDLAMKDLCYECSQDGVCLNSFVCAFVQKEVTCTNKNYGLRYTNKKLSLTGDIVIYAPRRI